MDEMAYSSVIFNKFNQIAKTIKYHIKIIKNKITMASTDTEQMQEGPRVPTTIRDFFLIDPHFKVNFAYLVVMFQTH